MSLILLNRLPIPNLKHYCTLSISLFLIVILYGQKVLFSIKNDDYYNEQFNSTYLQANGYVYTFTTALANEPWCIWVMINCCYCALLLFSKLLQKMIFGNLRVVEYQVRSLVNHTMLIIILKDYLIIISSFFLFIAHKRSLLEFYISKIYIHIWCFKFGECK